MRKSYKKKKEIGGIAFAKNEDITAENLKLIDEEGNDLGVMTKEKALQIAQEKEVDLVEVAPKAVPPVAKLLNYGKFIYQKEKQFQKQKAKQKKIDIKGIRLSLRIGEHDKQLKREQAKKFLEQGDKVKIEMIMKGRENQYAQNGEELVRDFINQINTALPTGTESPLEKMGNRITVIIYKK